MGKSKTKPLGLKKLLSEASTPEERQAILDGLPHDVGFAKPPKSTQFKKGQSGNSKGRRKGIRNFGTVLSDELNQKIEVIEGGRKRKKTKGEIALAQVVNKAAQGDLRANAIVFDWLRKTGQLSEGPVEQPQVLDAETVKILGEIMHFYKSDAVEPVDGGGQ